MNNCYCDILKCCTVCNLCTSRHDNGCCHKQYPENKCNERNYECCNVDRCGYVTKKKCCEKSCCYIDKCGCKKQCCETKCVIETCKKTPCCKINYCCDKGNNGCCDNGNDCYEYEKDYGCCNKCGNTSNSCDCNKSNNSCPKHCNCDKCCDNKSKCDDVVRCNDYNGGHTHCNKGGEWSDFMSINCGGYDSCEKKQEPKQNDCRTYTVSCPKRCCSDVMPLNEYWRNCCK